MQFRPNGVCPSMIDINVNEGIIESVEFTGGCNGNLQAVSSLVSGMKVEEAIPKLKGIKCGFRNTSCPDQLATALEQMIK